MSTAGKIGAIAGVALAVLFAWIAIDVGNDATSDVTEPRQRQPAAVAERQRPAQRQNAIGGDSGRDDFALERRDARDASGRAGERRLSEPERDIPPRSDEGTQPGGDGAPARDAAAAPQKKADATSGGGEEKKAPARFVPGPADLRPGAKLAGADMSGSQLVGVDLAGADLTDADLHDAKMDDINLEDAVLTSANLNGANMQRGSLVNADLHEARLDGADLRGAELEGVILTDASLTKTNIAGVTFGGADLAGANLSGAMLFGVDLRDTNLENADFQNADLRDANLTGVDISNALNLTCAQITVARGWQSAIRSEDLACGAPLPGDDG